MAHKHTKGEKRWRSQIRLPIPMSRRIKLLAKEGRRAVNTQLIMLIERGLVSP